METKNNSITGGDGHHARQTIMLVEDDPIVLGTTTRVLNRLGYAVLPYEHARDALAGARTYADKIHLLITDVLMPGMNGELLAWQMRQHLPDLRVLFMSGYTDDILAGICVDRAHFVSKPFTPQELAEKVRVIINNDF